MGGESENLKVQAAPLRTQEQMDFIDRYVRGIQRMMQDQILGMPYLGPYMEAYNPRKFTLSGGLSGAYDPWPGGGDVPPGPGPGPGPEPPDPPIPPDPPPIPQWFTPGINQIAGRYANQYTSPFVSPFYQALTGNFPRQNI